MNAVIQTGYGSPDALKMVEIPKPEVSEKKVLVKIHAVSLNAGDLFSLKGTPWLVRFSVGFPKPKDYILGWDLAGTIEAVGGEVTQFQPGDHVYGSCQHTLAEYVSAGEDSLAIKPDNLSFEHAATLGTAAITALHGLRNLGNLQPGQKVLINGASGGVGIYAVQIAKALGGEVTGVCSTRNVEMVHSLGADYVIDYTKEDFTKSGQQYDLILDNIASRSFADLKRALKPAGKLIPNSGHGGMGYVIKAALLKLFMPQIGDMFLAVPNNKDLVFLNNLFEAGQLKTIIDRTFPLHETPAAFRHLDEEHAQGKIVITMEDGI